MSLCLRANLILQTPVSLCEPFPTVSRAFVCGNSRKLKEEGLTMASEELMQISRDETERMRLLSEEKYILDNQSKLVSAERKGREEGIEIGRAENKAEIAQNKKEIARNFKASGVSLDIISQSTGLTLEEIAEL